MLHARLTRQLDRLPEGGAPGGERLRARVGRAQTKAWRDVLVVLDRPRYAALVDRLGAAAGSLPVTAAADQPAVEVMPALAGRAFRRLRSDARRLGKRPADPALHALRIRAKRARYAADVAVPVVGRPAVRYTKALGRLQDLLGDLHDGAMAELWLTHVAGHGTRDEAFVAGVLVARQRLEADELRGRWRPLWEAVDRPAVTSWLR